jgi:hypothetical protein
MSMQYSNDNTILYTEYYIANIIISIVVIFTFIIMIILFSRYFF